jgi:hypothetical protein
VSEPAVVISSPPRKELEIVLVGKAYTIKIPKVAVAMKLAVRAKTAGDDPTMMMQALDEWVARAFGPDGAKDIQSRLDDDEDDLDFPHMMMLMEKVLEAGSAGNPTTS